MRLWLVALVAVVAVGCGGNGGSGNAADGSASGEGVSGRDDALHVITLEEGEGPCTLSNIEEEDECPVAGQCFIDVSNVGDTSENCTEPAGAIRSVRIYGDEAAGTFDSFHIEFLEPGLRERGHWGLNVAFHDPTEPETEGPLDQVGCDQGDPADPIEADKEVVSYSQGIEVHATYEALSCRFDGDTLVVETNDVDPRPSTVFFDGALSLSVGTRQLPDGRYTQSSTIHLYPYSRRAA